MLTRVFRNWWLIALRGVLAIAFGVLALVWPRQTLLVLVVLFGAFALVDGICTAIAGASTHLYNDRWWAAVLSGLAGIAIGLLTLLWPHATAYALLYFIAAWAVVTGALWIAAAIQLRRVVPGEWAAILNGMLSILFGALLFAFPGEGALGIAWAIGLDAIVFGVSHMVLAFRLRGVWRKLEAAGAAWRRVVGE